MTDSWGPLGKPSKEVVERWSNMPHGQFKHLAARMIENGFKYEGVVIKVQQIIRREQVRVGYLDYNGIAEDLIREVGEGIKNKTISDEDIDWTPSKEESITVLYKFNAAGHEHTVNVVNKPDEDNKGWF